MVTAARKPSESLGAIESPAFNSILPLARPRCGHSLDERLIPGGCHVPCPAGNIDGGLVFGQ
jgi:hypothetical protein